MILYTLILAAAAALSNAATTEAELFRCDFGESSDQNYDSWPDGWTRAVGPKYPNYVKVRLAADPEDERNRCLQIDLDGGAAIAYSPAIPINPRESLVLTGRMKTSGLELHRAWMSITLLDKSQKPIGGFNSPMRHEEGEWNVYQVGPIAPAATACYAVIGLHLEPTAQGDLTGFAYFDDLFVERLVRIDMDVDQAQHLYATGAPVKLTCHVSGFGKDKPKLQVELFDSEDQQLEEAALPLSPQGNGDVLTAEWSAPIRQSGFYRIRSRLTQTDRPVHERELTVVVYVPHEATGKSEFGWSFSRGEMDVPLADLPHLASVAGNGWIKFPVWISANDEPRIRTMIDLIDRCNSKRLNVVGILSQPPDEVTKALGTSGPLTAAGVFTSDPKNWYPALETILSRLGLRIRWWQLGDDSDASFHGYADLPNRIMLIKKELDRIAQDVYVGFSWNWTEAAPPAQQIPWRFVSYTGDPPLTPEELGAYLKPLETRSDRRWVSLTPLAKDQYDSETRVADLLLQMVAAKANGASAVFAADPTNAAHGLLAEAGAPGERFLPWRTAAHELGGTTYLGRVDLPNGSRNELFSRGGQAMMVVWNATPTTETLYLGEKVQQIDAWERELPIENNGHEQVIQVGPTPTFVRGVNEAIARWRSTFSFENGKLPNVFGQPHRNACIMRNHFAVSVTGRVQLTAPSGWSLRPSRFDFKLAPGETLSQPLEIELPYDATSASQDVQAEIEVMADRRYRFQVLRRLEVGLGDLVLEAQTRLNEYGDLEIEQRIINNTGKELGFRCSLYAPGRRRTSVDLEHIVQGQDTRTFTLPDGKDLIGQQLWLRAEELDGDRVLNQRVEATP